MRMQDSQASCGAYALLNGLCALGITRSPEELVALCGVSATDGTSTAKLLKAAGKVEGTSPWKIAVSRADVASGLLFLALSNGRPVLPAVDRGEHWIAVVGHLKDRLLIADSAHNDLVLSLDAATFMDRWNGGGRAAYTAVVL